LTISEALKIATNCLEQKKVPRPKLEGEVLIRETLKLRRASLFLESARPLSSTEELRFFEVVRRRSEGVPLQYIFGGTVFRQLNLILREGVFIPRSETELLVEHVLEEIQFQKRVFFLDVGTGSGAIALSLAYEAPQSFGWGLDISDRALRAAYDNARAHNLEEKVTFAKSDLFQTLNQSLDRVFDVIVSNPPYVSRADISLLSPEIKNFEPLHALDGGEDGLDFIKKIIQQGPYYLRKKGLLALEVGFGQARAVKKLLAGSGDFREIRIFKDFSGIERIVLGARA